MVWQRVKTRQLQIWTEHSTLIFENLKSVEPKGEDSSCKIDGFMTACMSKLKWAWQA